MGPSQRIDACHQHAISASRAIHSLNGCASTSDANWVEIFDHDCEGYGNSSPATLVRRTGGGFEYAGLSEDVRKEELAEPFVGEGKVMVTLQALMRKPAADHPDRPPSKRNLEVLAEMLRLAEAAAAEDASRFCTSAEVTLVRVLKAYETVMRKHNLKPSQDAYYFPVILRMSLDPDMNWWAKLNRLSHSDGGAGFAPSGSHLARKSVCNGKESEHAPARTQRPTCAVQDSASFNNGLLGPRRTQAVEDVSLDIPINRFLETRTFLGTASNEDSKQDRRPQRAYDEYRTSAAYRAFKLMASVFRMWAEVVRSEVCLRRQILEADNLMATAVAWWERQTLARVLQRWMDRPQVYLLHAVALWRRTAERERFLWWFARVQRRRWGRQVAVRHWTRRMSQLALQALVDYPPAANHKRRALSRAQVLYEQTSMLKCWRAWEECREDGALLKAEVCCITAAGFKRRVARAWAATVRARLHQQTSLQSLVQTTSRRRKAKLFAEWRKRSQYHLQLDLKLDRCCTRVSHLLLVQSLRIWKEAAGVHRRQVLFLRLHEKLRILQRQGVMRAWKDRARCQRHVCSHLAVHLARTRRRLERRALLTWRALTEQLLQCAISAHELTQRCAAAVVHSCYAAWCFAYHSLRRQHLAQGVMGGCKCRRLYHAWQEIVSHKRWRRLLLEGARFKLVRKILRAVFSLWSWQCKRSQRIKASLDNALCVARARTRAAALREWRLWASASSARRLLMLRTSANFSIKRRQLCLLFWKSWCLDRAHKSIRVARADSHQRRRRERGALLEWLEYVRVRGMKDVYADRAVNYMCRARTALVALAWREWARRRQGLRALGDYAHQVWCVRHVHQAVLAWDAYVLAVHDKKLQIQRARLFGLVRWGDLAWAGWRRALQLARIRHDKLERKVRVLRFRAMKFTFCAWLQAARYVRGKRDAGEMCIFRAWLGEVRLGLTAHTLPTRLRQRMQAALLGRGLMMKRCFLRLRANSDAHEREERALVQAGRARAARLMAGWLLRVVRRKEAAWLSVVGLAQRRATVLGRAWRAWLEGRVFKTLRREVLSDISPRRLVEGSTLLEWMRGCRRVEGTHCLVQSKLLAAVSDAWKRCFEPPCLQQDSPLRASSRLMSELASTFECVAGIAQAASRAHQAVVRVCGGRHLRGFFLWPGRLHLPGLQRELDGEGASSLGAGSCLGLLCDTSKRLTESERSLLNVLFAEHSLLCFGHSLRCAHSAENVSSLLQERTHRLTLCRHVLQEHVYQTRVTVLACVMHRWQKRTYKAYNLRRGIHCWCMRVQSEAFARWRSESKQGPVGRRADSWYWSRVYMRCFNAWHAELSHQQYKGGQHTRARVHFQRRLTFIALHTWLHRTVNRKVVARVLEKTRQRRRLAATCTIFVMWKVRARVAWRLPLHISRFEAMVGPAAWKVLLDAHLTRCNQMQTADAKGRKICLRKHLECWRVAYHSVLRNRMSALLMQEKCRSNPQLAAQARLVVRRWRRWPHLGTAFTAWEECSLAQQHERALNKRALEYLQTKTCRVCLEGMRAAVEQRRLLRVCNAIYTRSLLLKAISTMQVLTMENLRHRRIITVVTRSRLRHQAGAWREVAAIMQRRRRTLQAALERRLRRWLRLLVALWREGTRARQLKIDQRRTAHTHHRLKVLGACVRSLQCLLRRLNNVGKLKRGRELRCRHQILRSWACHAQLQTRVHHLFACRRTQRTWLVWRARAAAVSRLRLGLSTYARSSLARCFQAFRVVVSMRHERRAVKFRSVQQLWTAWQAWSGVVMWRRFQSQNASVAARHFWCSLCLSVVKHWRRELGNCKRWRQQCTRVQEASERRVQLLALGLWRLSYWAVQSHRVRVLDKALRAWRDRCVQQQLRRHKVECALSALEARAIVHCWFAWTSAVARALQKKKAYQMALIVGDKVLFELRTQLKQSCLEGWRAVARRARECAALLTQHLHRRLVSVLHSWSRYACAASFHRAAVLRLQLWRWKQHVWDERCREESCRALADDFRLHSCAGFCFEVWKQFMLLGQLQVDALGRCIDGALFRVDNMRRRLAFELWAAYVEHRFSKRGKWLRAQQRWHHHLLGSMLLMWRAYTTINPQSLPSELIQHHVERSRRHSDCSSCITTGSTGDAIGSVPDVSVHTSPCVEQPTTSFVWDHGGRDDTVSIEDASPLVADSSSQCSTGVELSAVVLRPTKHLQRDHTLEFTPPSSFKEKLALFNTLAEAEGSVRRHAQDVSAPVPRRQSASSLVRRMQQRTEAAEN